MERTLRESIMSWKERYAKDKKDPCWKGYHQCGMKEKNGRQVPNCIPEGEDE